MSKTSKRQRAAKPRKRPSPPPAQAPAQALADEAALGVGAPTEELPAEMQEVMCHNSREVEQLAVEESPLTNARAAVPAQMPAPPAPLTSLAKAKRWLASIFAAPKR